MLFYWLKQTPDIVISGGINQVLQIKKFSVHTVTVRPYGRTELTYFDYYREKHLRLWQPQI